MAKYLILIFFLFSCESHLHEKPYQPIYQELHINAVQKNINILNKSIGPYNEQVENSLIHWIDNGIKLIGFEGDLQINILSIITSEEIIDNGVKISLTLELDLIISKKALESIKTTSLKGNDFIELTGEFSLIDKDIAVDNLINFFLEKFTYKLSDQFY